MPLYDARLVPGILANCPAGAATPLPLPSGDVSLRPPAMILSEPALDLVFRSARTHTHWLDRPVDDQTLHALYDLLRWGPTSANCSPARIVFVRSRDA